MSRVYNFSAGPAVLPEEVLKEVADEMMDYNGTGMSVMEMSHRSAAFQEIIDTAEKDLRELMNIPDNYKVLFLQGGASQQFAMIPMNLMKNKVADYIEDKRPIGADVKVSAAIALEITITASVKAKSGYSGDFISSTLYTLLNDYLAKLSGNNPLISYIKMADIIFSCEGVEDVTDYTLNGGKISITVENRYFPKAVMPVITVEE